MWRPMTIARLPVVTPHAFSAPSSSPVVPGNDGPSTSSDYWLGTLRPALLSPHSIEKAGSFGVAIRLMAARASRSVRT